MGKKMRLPFLFKTTVGRPPAWPWPSCSQPRTLSFRTTDNDILRTLNSASSESTVVAGETPDSFFTNTSFERGSFSTASEHFAGDHIETMIQGLRAERLFFKLGETSSILEEAKDDEELVLKESVILAMDSRDPYLDFRKSMAEMVEAQGLRKWKGLEELLCWYLRLNTESSHGYILEAFADLLASLSFSSSSCSCCHHCQRFVSSSSSFATNGCVLSQKIGEIDTSSSCIFS